MKEIIIPGKPIPLQRHRVSRGRHYDPQAKVKKDLIYSIRDQLEGIVVSDRPIAIEAEFSYAFARSWSKKKLREYRDLGRVPRTATPDYDNLCKFFDIFTGIIWKDDSQIFQALVTKFYSEESYTRLAWIEL